MSLYNMLHGIEPTAPFVFGVLSLHPSTVHRFRDAYITYRDGTQKEAIGVIMARTGEGAWTEQTNSFDDHPQFLDAANDTSDQTFRLYRFTIPAAYQKNCLDYLREHGAPLSLKEKMEQAIGPDQTVRQRAAAAIVTEKLRTIIDKA